MLFSPSAKLTVCERVIISVLFPAKRYFGVKKVSMFLNKQLQHSWKKNLAEYKYRIYLLQKLIPFISRKHCYFNFFFVTDKLILKQHEQFVLLLKILAFWRFCWNELKLLSKILLEVSFFAASSCQLRYDVGVVNKKLHRPITCPF